MTVRTEAYMAIEAGLMSRLSQQWQVIAKRAWDEVLKEIEEGDFAAAYAIAHSLDLSDVYENNKEYIKYATYAALTFGATRLTERARDTIVARGNLKAVVLRAMKHLKGMIAYAVTEQVRNSMVQVIALEEKTRVVKYDPSQPRDERGRWTDANVSSIGLAWSSTAPSVLDLPGKFEGEIKRAALINPDERKAQHVQLSQLIELLDTKAQLEKDMDRKQEIYSALSAAIYTREALNSSAPGERRFVALGKDGDVAGGATMTLLSKDIATLDYLGSLQRGAGSKLLASVEALAREEGATRLQLISTTYAENFYSSRGYKKIRPQTSNIMEKDLTQTTKMDIDELEPIGILAMSAQFEKVLKYDPNQPRDARGRWTDTGAFKEWFGDSKIVDENGKPRVVYHGTKKDFDTFRARYDDSLLFFSTNPKFAATWPEGTGGKGDLREPPEGTSEEIKRIRQIEQEVRQRVYPKGLDNYDFNTPEGIAAYDADRELFRNEMMRATGGFISGMDFEMKAGIRVLPVYLSVQKPFDPRKDYALLEDTLRGYGHGMDKIMAQGHHKQGNWLVYENKAVIQKLKDLGYDGIWLAEEQGGVIETIAVFSPKQVKSAIGNRGTFDPDDPSILKKEGGNPYHKPAGRPDGGQFTSQAEAGFSYSKEKGWLDSEGNQLPEKVAARLKELRVPPAWRGVILSDDPHAELQATGIDSKGRKQYLYSSEHSAKAAAEKFSRLKEFNEKLPQINQKISARLGDESLSTKERDAMAILRLISKTGIRIGSDAETGGAAKAYGASTLLDKHVVVRDDDSLHLSFVGKKGVLNTRTFKDPKLAEYIRGKKRRLRSNEKLFEANDSFVRSEFAKIGYSDFSPKDFRTWHGTAQALLEVKRHGTPSNDKEMKKLRAAVGKRVASYLGNTPTVALASYVDPAVFKMALTT